MSSEITSDTGALGASSPWRMSRIGHLASLAFLGVMPVLVILILFGSTLSDDTVAMDFGQYYRAAHVVLQGGDPYSGDGEPLTAWGGPYPYPPLPALMVAPLTAVSIKTAGLLMMAALVFVPLAVLWILGVRDWRCYGLVMLWPPVISAIQTANVTLWFALALALVWRFRDGKFAASTSLGITLAVKFFLWPVVVWMVATRRYASAGLACVIGVALLLASWAVIGFSGLTSYPDLLRRVQDVVGDDSYTAYIVGLDLGLPSELARTVWLALGLGLLGGIVLLGRRRDERAAFILAIAAALALTPIVWLHYFALLVVPVAVSRPRLGVVWFVPLAMVVTPGSGHPTPFETAWTLVVASVTVGLAVRASQASSGRGEVAASSSLAVAS